MYSYIAYVGYFVNNNKKLYSKLKGVNSALFCINISSYNVLRFIMPIISRTLTKLANRDDIKPGFKKWRVDGVDGRGARWTLGPFGGTQVEAEVIRDSAWSQDQLDDQDERSGVEFILDGGAPESFAREDLTLQEWRRRLAKRFWRRTIDTDREFLCKISPYIATFTAVQIANTLGIPVAKAQKGLDRAIDLRDNICPGMDSTDADADEDL